MKPKVFVPEPIAAGGMDLLKAECECLAPWEGEGAGAPDRYRDLLFDADAVVVRLFAVKADDIQRARRLKVIAKHGVGVDNIDCAAATVRRIPVVYTPTANANAVAEHTLALMLALARNILPAGAALLEGRFNERGRFEGVELSGKTLGVVGLGRIGGRVAEMAGLGFGMVVCGFDPFLVRESYKGPAILVDSLEALLSRADFLTLHAPLTPDTRHLLDAERLAQIKPGCRVVNTSRGALIDEAALARALSEGTIAGAALDVFEEEPISPDNPLCRAPNALLTPHISSSTRESLERMALQAAQGILDVLHGTAPRYVVNPEVLA